MQQNEYFFDKRNIKKGIKKYGLIFLCLMPILIGLNILIQKLGTAWIIIIDVVLAFSVVIVVNLIIQKVQDKKLQLLENELKRQKQLEQSKRNIEKRTKDKRKHL